MSEVMFYVVYSRYKSRVWCHGVFNNFDDASLFKSSLDNSRKSGRYMANYYIRRFQNWNDSLSLSDILKHLDSFIDDTYYMI